MFPKLFVNVSKAIVALVTVKWRSLMLGVDPPLQLAGSVHETPAVKVPVPSAIIGDELVTPVRPPVMLTFAPFSVAVMPVTVEPLMLSLNRNSESPPAPVSTNSIPAVQHHVEIDRRPRLRQRHSAKLRRGTTAAREMARCEVKCISVADTCHSHAHCEKSSYAFQGRSYPHG